MLSVISKVRFCFGALVMWVFDAWSWSFFFFNNFFGAFLTWRLDMCLMRFKFFFFFSFVGGGIVFSQGRARVQDVCLGHFTLWYIF